MSIYRRVVLFVACLIVVPAGLSAQNDVCSTIPSVESVLGQNRGSDVIVELVKERAEMLTRQETERARWTVQMFPVKYLDSAEALKPLCLFSVEIVPQPALHLISVRAAPDNLVAIGEAIKRLDVPQIPPKSVEVTVQVLMASDGAENMRPVPAGLKPVVDQLRNIVAYKEFYLVDTLLGSVADANRLNLSGSVRGLRTIANGAPTDSTISFSSIVRVDNHEQAPLDGTLPGSFRVSQVVRLQALSFALDGGAVKISTEVDVPPGKQVVVGKATSGDRAFVLVVSVKMLN